MVKKIKILFGELGTDYSSETKEDFANLHKLNDYLRNSKV